MQLFCKLLISVDAWSAPGDNTCGGSAHVPVGTVGHVGQIVHTFPPLSSPQSTLSPPLQSLPSRRPASHVLLLAFPPHCMPHYTMRSVSRFLRPFNRSFSNSLTMHGVSLQRFTMAVTAFEVKGQLRHFFDVRFRSFLKVGVDRLTNKGER